MDSDTVVEQIVRSLSFEVEAVPQDIVQVSSTSKSTPFNLRIKVRKKDKADIQHGFISVPKVDQPDGAPKRIRLVSSDKTLMSFDVFMETDLAQKPLRKPRKHIFDILRPGACLGAQRDDDNYSYMPKSEGSNSSKSDGLIKQNLTLAKINDNNVNISPTHSYRHKHFFGKCKPGGCLDPPFSEDKYSYAPATLKDIIPAQNISKKNISDSKDMRTKQDSNSFFRKKKKSIDSCSPQKAINKQKPDTDSILSLYQAESMRTSTTYSNSIITYPPAITSSEIRIYGNKTRLSSEDRSRKSFNGVVESYYTSPKKVTNNFNQNSDTNSNRDRKVFTGKHDDINKNIEKKQFIPSELPLNNQKNNELSSIKSETFERNMEFLQINVPEINETDSLIKKCKAESSHTNLKMKPSHIETPQTEIMKIVSSPYANLRSSNLNDDKSITVAQPKRSGEIQLQASISMDNQHPAYQVNKEKNTDQSENFKPNDPLLIIHESPIDDVHVQSINSRNDNFFSKKDNLPLQTSEEKLNLIKQLDESIDKFHKNKKGNNVDEINSCENGLNESGSAAREEKFAILEKTNKIIPNEKPSIGAITSLPGATKISSCTPSYLKIENNSLNSTASANLKSYKYGTPDEDKGITRPEKEDEINETSSNQSLLKNEVPKITDSQITDNQNFINNKTDGSNLTFHSLSNNLVLNKENPSKESLIPKQFEKQILISDNSISKPISGPMAVDMKEDQSDAFSFVTENRANDEIIDVLLNNKYTPKIIDTFKINSLSPKTSVDQIQSSKYSDADKIEILNNTHPEHTEDIPLQVTDSKADGEIEHNGDKISAILLDENLKKYNIGENLKGVSTEPPTYTLYDTKLENTNNQNEESIASNNALDITHSLPQDIEKLQEALGDKYEMNNDNRIESSLRTHFESKDVTVGIKDVIEEDDINNDIGTAHKNVGKSFVTSDIEEHEVKNSKIFPAETSTVLQLTAPNKTILKNNTLSVEVDLAFQSYVNDNNHRVVKSFTSASVPERSSKESIFIFKSHLTSNSNVIKIPVDSETDLSIQIEMRNFTSKRASESGNVKLGSKINLVPEAMVPVGGIEAETEDKNKSEINNYTKNTCDVLLRDNLIAMLYNQELVPLQNVIQDLKEEIDTLAKQKIIFNKSLYGLRTPSKMRLIKVNKKCVCSRKQL